MPESLIALRMVLRPRARFSWLQILSARVSGSEGQPNEALHLTALPAAFCLFSVFIVRFLSRPRPAYWAVGELWCSA
jgi:hypothetical protein